MRLTLVTETYAPEINGVAKTLQRIVNELTARGHDIHIIRPGQKNEAAVNSASYTTVSGLPIPGYSGLQFGLPAGRLLAKLWRQQTPDIIYVATEGPLGASAISTAKKFNIPVVSGFHTNFDVYSKHYRLGWLEKLIFLYLKRLHNRTMCTLAPSPELVSRLKNRGICNAELFSRGVDTDIYNPCHRQPALRAQWHIADDAPLAIHVGRIAAEKNIELVIESYHAMQQAQPELRLMMVGDGPLLGKLKQRHPDIIFTGPKVGIELSQHYASADIFLFASESETFGNVVLEAMSSGLAVVAYDYAAARMHINNQLNGLVVQPGKPAEFRNAAVKLVKQPETINAIRNQARLTAEKLDWTHIIDHFEKVLVRYVKSKPCAKRKSEQAVSADGSA
jgi:glycosyltransferase involved in cell wall biosynthesis